MTELILSPDSHIYRRFTELVERADYVFFAGLPGVGKSLLLQQMTLMAIAAGRRVHHLQWDTARQVFESPDYPLRDGATHPTVIKAVGIWLRQALVDWDKSQHKPANMLIGEVPLIGGRLMEIVRPASDAAEALLVDPRTQFVLPVPSRQVRALIENKRENTIAHPQHENESQDAPPNLLRALWQDLFRVAGQLGFAENSVAGVSYSPEIYEAVYSYLLQHRHFQPLPIDEPLQPVGSVYDFNLELPQLIATDAMAQAILAQLEASRSSEDVSAAAANWYKL